MRPPPRLKCRAPGVLRAESARAAATYAERSSNITVAAAHDEEKCEAGAKIERSKNRSCCVAGAGAGAALLLWLKRMLPFAAACCGGIAAVKPRWTLPPPPLLGCVGTRTWYPVLKQCVRNRMKPRFVRFTYAVHRRETAVLLMRQENLENRKTRGFVRFIFTGQCRENTILHGFSYGDWPRTVAKSIQRRTAPNRTVGFITVSNRTVKIAVYEIRTEPHRRIFKTAPNRTVGYFTALNRTVGFTLSENRT